MPTTGTQLRGRNGSIRGVILSGRHNRGCLPGFLFWSACSLLPRAPAVFFTVHGRSGVVASAPPVQLRIRTPTTRRNLFAALSLVRRAVFFLHLAALSLVRRAVFSSSILPLFL